MKKECPAPLRFPEVRVVEASAGSGKTYALARRYLQLLMDTQSGIEDVRGILAITFTNAATREMKERILDLLKKIALDAFSTASEREDILRSLPAERSVARRKARALIEYLMRHYNYFQVQTIDSFINVLLSGCASELGLSAGFRIREDCREYLAYSLDGCIDEAHHDARVKRLFENFLHQYLHVEYKRGWFPKSDMLGIIASLYAHHSRYGGEFEKSGVEGRALILRKRAVKELVQELRERCPAGTNKKFLSALDGYLAKGARLIDLGALTSVYFTRDEFPVNKGHAAPERTLILWKRLREGIVAVAEEEARSVFDCYIDIFGEVMRQFSARARKDDCVFLEELNRRAGELFDGKLVSVPEIYYRLASRFRHYLIDEFQDTSVLQWSNLSAMIEEALSTGGSLFYVGDKKQAIYRFRGGEVALFDQVPRRFSAFHARRESLSENYRSQRHIIEFNNEVFSMENLRRFLSVCQPGDDDDRRKLTDADMRAVVEIFRDSRQACDGARPYGFVRAELVEGEGGEEARELIREKLLHLVRELCERFRLEDIAILTRGNVEVELITSWLMSGGVRAESEKTLNIRYNPHIKELVSLLAFLNSPIGDLSFASFILGDIFSRASGIPRGAIEDFLFSARGASGGGAEYLYRGFRARYPGAWDACMDELFRNVGFVPLYELVVNIMERFGVCRHFAGSQAFFMRFLELIKEREEEGASVDEFLRYFECGAGEDLFVAFSDVNAVKVMTIHKSKGLQFPVVIAPFLEFSPGTTGAGGISHAVTREGESLFLLRLDGKYTRFSRGLRDVYREEYVRALIDELNVIYVACTRPEEELYLFVPCGGGRDENLARQLIPPGRMERGTRRERGRPGRAEAPPATQLPPPEYRDWMPFLKDEYIDIDTIIHRRSILRGEAIHCMLSHIGNLQGADVERAVSRAVEKTLLRFPSVSGMAEIERVVRSLMEDPRIRPFFFVEGGEVFSEKGAVDALGRERRIDRLVVKKDEAWIIDFKSSGRGVDAHRGQIRGYAGIIADMYPPLRIRSFLVFLDEVRVEEVE